MATPQTAHAAVVAGDIVFEQFSTSSGQYTIQRRASNGALTNLSTGSLGYDDHSPDVSPDGSRIAFIGARPADGNSANGTVLVLMVMNSDGSGQTALIAPSSTSHEVDGSPVWSPDGTKIAYEKQVYNNHFIAVINADGTGDTTLTSGGQEYKPTWSADGTKIAYEGPGVSTTQIYVMNAGGSNQHLLPSSDTGDVDVQPVWSPDGNRIYFLSSHSTAGIYYFTTSNGWTTGSISYLGGPFQNSGTEKLKISADGSLLTYSRPNGGCSKVFTISTSSASTTQITSPTCANNADYAPTFVWSDWSIKRFTVLGDSFAAGEGVPDFISPSDTDGCHRSESAFARVLNSRPVGLALDAFVACSGAITAEVIDGKNGEGSQLTSIDTSDDYVILTAGGNDVQFGDFATDCVELNCDGSDQYDATEDLIQNVLPDDLDTLYAEISGSIGSGTRILVLGYPYILPLSSQTGISCLYLTSGERVAATNVQIDLNSAVQAAVDRAQANGISIEYVDPNGTGSPFDGHQLCSTGNYFNGLTMPPNAEYSFHPNEDGQVAYAQVVASYLAAHPTAP